MARSETVLMRARRSQFRTGLRSGRRDFIRLRGQSRPCPQRCADPCNSLSTAMNAELLANIVDVILDCGGFDSQLTSDLLVREPAIDEMRDLELAPRQRHRTRVMQVDDIRSVIIVGRQRCHAAVE